MKKITPVGSNMTELTLTDGTSILFSYTTPVAAFLPGEGFIRTEVNFSVTTTKHITKWILSNGGTPANATTVPQDTIQSLVQTA